MPTITRLSGANAISGTLPAANINDTSISNITALPAGSALQVLDGGAKFVVQNNDALKVISDTASSLDVWVSTVDAIST